MQGTCKISRQLGMGYYYDSIDGNSEDKAVVLGLEFNAFEIHTSINRETPGSINR
jgi:hypothetical protein